MQNRYVGDVGDFGKFGLLRFLSGLTDTKEREPVSLGVIWYLRPDERHNSDGRHIGYLVPTDKNIRKYGGCDRDLWARLGHLVGQGARCVHCVEQAAILPEGTQYHRSFHHIPPDAPQDVKRIVREHWFERRARTTVRDAGLVFLDPDKGVSRTNANRYQEAGTKYAYLGDLRTLFHQDGRSLVIYHHVPHATTAQQEARTFANQLQGDLGLEEPIPCLRFRRGSAPVFFIIPQPDDRPTYRGHIDRFLGTPWRQYFGEV